MHYSAKDAQRLKPIKKDQRFSVEKYRTPWRRDYGRLIHSPSFRRLQGKSQLFPQQETDFFRNRLTHSLEVAQIAKSIAIKLNSDLEDISSWVDIAKATLILSNLPHWHMILAILPLAILVKKFLMRI